MPASVASLTARIHFLCAAFAASVLVWCLRSSSAMRLCRSFSIDVSAVVVTLMPGVFPAPELPTTTAQMAIGSRQLC